MNVSDTKPTDRLERALRASLRPVDPGAEFTAAVQARLLSPGLHSSVSDRVGPSMRRRWAHSASMALAASISLALAVGWQLQDLHAWRQAEQARLEQARVQTQLLLALEITSERLGQARQRIEEYQSQEKRL